MSNQPNEDKNRVHATEQEAEFTEMVCAPEFPDGCIDPMEDARVIVNANDAILRDGQCAVGSNSAPTEEESSEELMPIQSDEELAEQGLNFAETVCSPEFPQGCVKPVEEK